MRKNEAQQGKADTSCWKREVIAAAVAADLKHLGRECGIVTTRSTLRPPCPCFPLVFVGRQENLVKPVTLPYHVPRAPGSQDLTCLFFCSLLSPSVCQVGDIFCTFGVIKVLYALFFCLPLF